MLRKLRLIDKFRRPSWLRGRDRYYFVLRVEDGRGIDSKIYERQVSRQCYYRFTVGELAYSKNPAAPKQFSHPDDEVC